MTSHHDTCAGVPPLPGRLAPWMRAALSNPTDLQALCDEHGSPVNVLHTAPMTSNAADLIDAGKRHGITPRIFFARKANKALAFVDQAVVDGHGVDVASECELRQVLDRGVPPQRVIVSAAVKPASLLQRCIDAGVCVSLDNLDELAQLRQLAASAGTQPAVALRLAAVLPPPAPATRFGLSADQWRAALTGAALDGVRVAGIHFHLHGYDSGQRAVALDQAINLGLAARTAGHHVTFIDMGGGVPMRYLDSPQPWDAFWDAHTQALLDGNPLTWDGRGLGLRLHDGVVTGVPNVYPMWQDAVRGEWLEQILSAPSTVGGSIGQRLLATDFALHLEPGRSLLDGCGMTLARIEFRKQRSDGSNLVGLAMNRTQCCSAADDFLLDPILLPVGQGQRSDPVEAFVVGAYCIEAELITARKLSFSAGVAVGDLMVFVNTGGYQMHILESASHQIPLAINVVRTSDGAGWYVDDIDGSHS